MSPASQTLRAHWRWLLSLTAVAAIVALSLAPVGRQVAALARQARPHAPDMEVFLRLSPMIKIHLLAALAALALGALLMAARKGRTFHRTAGWMWVGLVSVTAGSTLFITSLNHGRWSWLHLFTGWTLIILPVAVLAARRRNIVRHRRSMMGLFYGGFAINLLIAFIPGRALWQMFFG